MKYFDGIEWIFTDEFIFLFKLIRHQMNRLFSNTFLNDVMDIQKKTRRCFRSVLKYLFYHHFCKITLKRIRSAIAKGGRWSINGQSLFWNELSVKKTIWFKTNQDQLSWLEKKWHRKQIKTRKSIFLSKAVDTLNYPRWTSASNHSKHLSSHLKNVSKE